MRRIQTLMAAAAVACGGMYAFSVGAADPAPLTPPSLTPPGEIRTETKTTERIPGDLAREQKVTAVAPDADDIRKSVAAATENAVSKGGFDNLAGKLVDADRDRVKKFKPADNFATLDGRIEQFRKDWKSKYNQDFGFERQRGDVYNDGFAKITQGEIGEARTASGKVPSAEPQNVTGGTAEDLKKSGVSAPDANSNKYGGGNTNREPGRNIATFTISGAMDKMRDQAKMNVPANDVTNKAIAAADKMSGELAIPMIHELPDTWKIDLPDNIDGQRLYDNLVKHLTMVDEDRANWPADVNEAYRTVTRHMMQAVMEGGSM